MHLFHIPQSSIQNRNVYISVLNGALWDMEQVHSGIGELAQFSGCETFRLLHVTGNDMMYCKKNALDDQLLKLHGTLCYSIGYINRVRSRQNGCHFADSILKLIFMHENCVLMQNCPFNNNPALVQILAYCQTGEKPIFEPMIVLFTDPYIHHSSMVINKQKFWSTFIKINFLPCIFPSFYVMHDFITG